MFLKNKKTKDKEKLAELGGATSSGTSSSLSTTSDGASPSDANINLANATILVGQRAVLNATIIKPCESERGFGINRTSADLVCMINKGKAKTQLVELEKKLATIGYKLDAIGQLVKI